MHRQPTLVEGGLRTLVWRSLISDDQSGDERRAETKSNNLAAERARSLLRARCFRPACSAARRQVPFQSSFFGAISPSRRYHRTNVKSRIPSRRKAYKLLRGKISKTPRLHVKIFVHTYVGREKAKMLLLRRGYRKLIDRSPRYTTRESAFSYADYGHSVSTRGIGVTVAR